MTPTCRWIIRSCVAATRAISRSGKVDTAFEDFRPFAWMTTADFSLGTTFADVKSLQWSSGRSSLEASGRISDFRNPRLDGSYDATSISAEAAAIARRHDLREGVAEFKGNGHWSLSELYDATRLLLAHCATWAGRDDQFALKKASG